MTRDGYETLDDGRVLYDFPLEENKLRFISDDLYKELINLYHLARCALAGGGVVTKYQRMIWATNELKKAHPEISVTGAYKDLSARLEGY